MNNTTFTKLDVVWHPHFGKGTVITVDSERDDAIQVKFEESTKTILSKFVKKMTAVSFDSSKSYLTVEQILGKLYDEGMKDVEIYDPYTMNDIEYLEIMEKISFTVDNLDLKDF